jgi:hypothetical protein
LITGMTLFLFAALFAVVGQNAFGSFPRAMGMTMMLTILLSMASEIVLSADVLSNTSDDGRLQIFIGALVVMPILGALLLAKQRRLP